MRKINAKKLVVAAVTMVAAGLSGCGRSETAQAVPDFNGIYTTAVDCGSSGKISYEDCSNVMAKAVEEHEKDAPTYNSERSCIAKEGESKCEHTAANGKYRPRLLAFLVTVSKTKKAKPLYAHPKGDAGFRDIGGSTYTTATEELVFSEHAQTMFEAQTGKRKGKH